MKLLQRSFALPSLLWLIKVICSSSSSSQLNSPSAIPKTQPKTYRSLFATLSTTSTKVPKSYSAFVECLYPLLDNEMVAEEVRFFLNEENISEQKFDEIVNDVQWKPKYDWNFFGKTLLKSTKSKIAQLLEVCFEDERKKKRNQKPPHLCFLKKINHLSSDKYTEEYSMNHLKFFIVDFIETPVHTSSKFHDLQRKNEIFDKAKDNSLPAPFNFFHFKTVCLNTSIDHLRDLLIHPDFSSIIFPVARTAADAQGMNTCSEIVSIMQILHESAKFGYDIKKSYSDFFKREGEEALSYKFFLPNFHTESISTLSINEKIHQCSLNANITKIPVHYCLLSLWGSPTPNLYDRNIVFSRYMSMANSDFFSQPRLFDSIKNETMNVDIEERQIFFNVISTIVGEDSYEYADQLLSLIPKGFLSKEESENCSNPYYCHQILKNVSMIEIWDRCKVDRKDQFEIHDCINKVKKFTKYAFHEHRIERYLLNTSIQESIDDDAVNLILERWDGILDQIQILPTPEYFFQAIPFISEELSTRILLSLDKTALDHLAKSGIISKMPDLSALSASLISADGISEAFKHEILYPHTLPQELFVDLVKGKDAIVFSTEMIKYEDLAKILNYDCFNDPSSDSFSFFTDHIIGEDMLRWEHLFFSKYHVEFTTKPDLFQNASPEFIRIVVASIIKVIASFEVRPGCFGISTEAHTIYLDAISKNLNLHVHGGDSLISDACRFGLSCFNGSGEKTIISYARSQSENMQKYRDVFFSTVTKPSQLGKLGLINFGFELNNQIDLNLHKDVFVDEADRFIYLTRKSLLEGENLYSSYLKVKIEEGQDGGALTRHWHAVVTQKLFSKESCLLDDNGNPFPLIDPAMGHLVGFMLGKGVQIQQSSNVVVSPEFLRLVVLVGTERKKASLDAIDQYLEKTFYVNQENILGSYLFGNILETFDIEKDQTFNFFHPKGSLDESFDGMIDEMREIDFANVDDPVDLIIASFTLHFSTPELLCINDLKNALPTDHKVCIQEVEQITGKIISQNYWKFIRQNYFEFALNFYEAFSKMFALADMQFFLDYPLPHDGFKLLSQLMSYEAIDVEKLVTHFLSVESSPVWDSTIPNVSISFKQTVSDFLCALSEESSEMYSRFLHFQTGSPTFNPLQNPGSHKKLDFTINAHASYGTRVYRAQDVMDVLRGQYDGGDHSVRYDASYFVKIVNRMHKLHCSRINLTAESCPSILTLDQQGLLSPNVIKSIDDLPRSNTSACFNKISGQYTSALEFIKTMMANLCLELGSFHDEFY